MHLRVTAVYPHVVFANAIVMVTHSPTYAEYGAAGRLIFRVQCGTLVYRSTHRTNRRSGESRAVSVRILFFIVVFTLISGRSSAASDPSSAAPPAVHRPTSAVWVTQAYKQGPADNALKGFMPYAGSFTTFPYSMEWFYIPWKDIQSGYNIYTWAALDDQLKTIADRGHQAVFRIYADYPKRAYGIPAFLSYVPKNAYTDNGNTTSFSPDYENADLRRAMKNLIAALGARYDGDARIGFIEVGFLGFWGEWHTYPHTAWFPSVTVQNEVLDAFENAFHTTKVMMREPKTGIHPVTRRIGYHDDSFAYNTFGPTEWYFWP